MFRTVIIRMLIKKKNDNFILSRISDFVERRTEQPDAMYSSFQTFRSAKTEETVSHLDVKRVGASPV